jgi:hypothetical protein
VLLAVAVAVGVCACGGSRDPGSASASAQVSSGIKFADCMRSHGVPNFPDPGSGGGIQITSGSGVDPQSPSFQAAQTDCQKLLPGGGPGKGSGSEARRLHLVNLAECMRKHGLTTFPDPTAGAPTAPPSGGGLTLGSPSGSLSIPQSLIQSPAFKQDAAACGFPLPGATAPKGAVSSAGP